MSVICRKSVVIFIFCVSWIFKKSLPDSCDSKRLLLQDSKKHTRGRSVVYIPLAEILFDSWISTIFLGRPRYTLESFAMSLISVRPSACWMFADCNITIHRIRMDVNVAPSHKAYSFSLTPSHVHLRSECSLRPQVLAWRDPPAELCVWSIAFLIACSTVEGFPVPVSRVFDVVSVRHDARCVRQKINVFGFHYAARCRNSRTHRYVYVTIR